MTIPANINNLAVTGIGDNVFEDTALSSVSIPNGVTSIGNSAFQFCTDLTNVTIPGSITTLGEGAFLACTSLTSVAIPGSIISFGDFAFQSCSALSSVTFAGVNNFGIGAFGYCLSLTNVKIPDNTGSIGAQSFYACTALTSVIVPKNVAVIGYEAFGACSSLTAITVDSQNSFYSGTNGVLFDKSQTELVEYPAGLGGAYAIPDNVTVIEEGAFAACSLANVTIPASVTNIEALAFSQCESLTNVSIPASVASIGNGAFASCTNLIGVYFQGNAPTIGSYVFTNDDATIYYLPGTSGWEPTYGGLPTIMGSGLGDNFDYMMNSDDTNTITITEYVGTNTVVIIPTNINNLLVTGIGDGENPNFTPSLASITIPGSVTNIGALAFLSCNNLSNVTIPNNVTSIGFGAFLACTSLASVTNGNSLSSIADYAFAYLSEPGGRVLPRQRSHR